MNADLVVIGAGALGLSTALHAALLGQSVIVVGRYKRISDLWIPVETAVSWPCS